MGEYFFGKIGLEKTKVECEMCDNSSSLPREGWKGRLDQRNNSREQGLGVYL